MILRRWRPRFPPRGDGGVNLGPAEVAAAQLDEENRFPRSLAGVEVLFDDTPAPLIFVASTQLGAVAPFGVAELEQTAVRVTFNGSSSAPVALAVAPASPGIFALNAQGSGQGAILNQDFTVNGPANPADRGTALQIFGTGGGLVDQEPIDGGLTPGLQNTLLPVRAFVGGIEAPVLYAGNAPGLVTGVLQVNALVDQATPVGDAVPVRIQAGEALSQEGPTAAIR